MCQNYLSDSRKPRGGQHVSGPHRSGSRETGASSRVKYTIDFSYPTFFHAIEGLVYSHERLTHDDQLYQNLTLEPSRTTTIQCAPKPFAQGFERICYYGVHSQGDKVVLKEFKDTRRDTFENHKAIIETAAVSNYLAKQFNNRVECKYGSAVYYELPLLLEVKNPMKTPSRAASFYTFEPRIEGKFE